MSARDEAAPLSELDLLIVHALQIDARLSWTRIAAVIGTEPSTVARRWAVLSEERTAWATLWPTPQRWARTSDIALVLLTSDDTVRDAIIDLPWVIGVDETSAGLLAIVADSRGLDALGARVRALRELGAHVERMTVIAQVTQEDSTWRLRALSREQQRSLSSPRGARAEVRPPAASALADLAAALEDDPRMPALTVAKRLGVSEPTARRTLDRAVGAGLLRFGCDLALPAAGWGRGAVLWGRSPDVTAAAVAAAHLPEAHRVGVVVGPAPLYLCVRARTLTALPSMESAWRSAADVDIVDRWTILRPWKRNGHVLDEGGRSLRRVRVEW